MSAERPLVYGQLGAASQVHVSRDGINVTDLGGTMRVRLGRIVEFQEAVTENDYGLVVRNPAGTVVIDGTSNMLKIAASGTLTPPNNATGPAEVSATVDLATGLTNPPAYLGFVNYGSGEARTLPYEISNWLGDGVGIDWYYMKVQVVNTDQTRVAAEVKTRRAGGLSGLPFRYFVMQEATF